MPDSSLGFLYEILYYDLIPSNPVLLGHCITDGESTHVHNGANKALSRNTTQHPSTRQSYCQVLLNVRMPNAYSERSLYTLSIILIYRTSSCE